MIWPSMELTMPSPSRSLLADPSQASPTRSPSASAWEAFGVSRQLSRIAGCRGADWPLGSLRYSSDAVTGLPNVPTIAEQGVPGFEYTLWVGLWGPAGMPAEVANKINADVNAALRSADAIAICLLHSYANDQHERRVARHGDLRLDLAHTEREVDDRFASELIIDSKESQECYDRKIRHKGGQQSPRLTGEISDRAHDDSAY